VHEDALTPGSTGSTGSTRSTASGSVADDPGVGPGAGPGPAVETTPRRGGPDPIALVGALVALVIAALAATGTLDAVDPRWILAAGALLVGGTVLIGTLRRRA
jgi:hypothetical protein